MESTRLKVPARECGVTTAVIARPKETPVTSTARGWYPDPASSEHLRWWDGTQWSEHTAINQGIAQDPTSQLRAKKKARGKVALIVVASVLAPILLITGGIAAIRWSNATPEAQLPTEVVSTSKAGYAYTEPLLDLDPRTDLIFPVEFDWDEKFGEIGLSKNPAFEVYLDPTLTKFASAFVYQSGAGQPLQIAPSESNTVHDFSGSHSPAAVMSIETSDWGIQSEYYLVRKIDERGEPLDTPVVTKFSAKKQFNSPVVSAAVNPVNGTVELSWDPVPGATEYVVIGSASVRDDNAEYRSYELLGTTSEATWSSKDSIDRDSPADFYPATQNLGLQLFENESADQLLGNQVWSLGNDDWERERSGLTWGVVATDGTNYSRIAEIDVSGIAGALPLRIAWNTMTQWGISSVMSDKFDGLGSIPRQFAFTSIDGVTRTTEARIPEGGITENGSEWLIRIEGVGTQLGQEIEFSFYDGASTTPEAFTAQFNAEAAALRPTTGLGNFAVISGTPEEISDAIDSAATQPAKTGYPVYGTDDYVKFIASHLIAGTEYIDASEFALTPGSQSFNDAFEEALYQNPYALASAGTQAITFNEVDGGERAIYHLRYGMEQSERAAIQNTLKQSVESVIASTVNDSMSPSDKAVALNNWVIANTVYDFDAFTASTSGGDISPYLASWRADGLFSSGLVVCLGYASAYSALMNAAGVPTVVVTGSVVSGGGHAWNKVDINGSWLAVDPTWNDSDYAANQYLLIPNSGFTGSAQRIEATDWIRDDLISSCATP